MSISNHSVNVKASTAALEALYANYEHLHGVQLNDPNADDAHTEWLESGMEVIEDELARREDEPSFGPAYDSPSLEDRGIVLGSYAN